MTMETESNDDTRNDGENIYTTVITGSGVAISEIVAAQLHHEHLEGKDNVKYYWISRRMTCMRDRHHANGELIGFNHLIVSHNTGNMRDEQNTVVFPANEKCELLSMLPLHIESSVINHDIAVSRWIDELVW